MKTTVYKDITDDGIHYTVFQDKECIGEFLADDIELIKHLDEVNRVRTCDWRTKS